MQNQDNCIFSLSEEETLIFTPTQITVLYQRIAGKTYEEIIQNNQYSKVIKGHYTTFNCFNADGSKVLKPFIILPNLKKSPKDIEFLKDQAFFVSSPSGWITQKLFTAFAVFFCHEISLFRIEN